VKRAEPRQNNALGPPAHPFLDLDTIYDPRPLCHEIRPVGAWLVTGHVREERELVTILSALVPAVILAWHERRRALGALESLQQREEWALALDDGNLVNRAKVALSVDDPTAALRYWQEALTRYPRFAKRSRDSLEVLLGLRLFDEAEELMLEGSKRAPRDLYYAGGYALVAERRGDNEEAIQRWNRVRKRFPGDAMGYVHGTICLNRGGQLAAADALNKKAIKLFPEDVRIWSESARIAEHRVDWPEAICRWQVVCERFKRVQGDLGIARALTELGRIEEAEQRLREAQGSFPLVHEIAVALARLASRRGDKEEAVRLWADTRRRFPVLPLGYQGGFRQLLEMGRYADAETLLLAAIDRFPAEAWPIVEYASLAHSQQDWAAAAARWAEIRRVWPDRQDGYIRGALALAALGRHDEAARLRTEHQHRFTR
jgi:tetratricopeptide (TPR) repeat protein